MADIRLAVTGFGNVGQGIAQLLLERGEEFDRQYGNRLFVTGVADRRGASVSRDGLPLQSLLDDKRRDGTVARGMHGVEGLAGTEFLERAEADILVEAASTNFEDAEPGWGYCQAALDRGMSLVLASKGALVLHFRQLMDLARMRDLPVRYSGTVGAPVPVLDLAERVLIGCRILGFEGIVNGTTNHILTAMDEGASYDVGLERAQAAGVAETDPTLDVDGWDAAAKVVIIANSVLGSGLTLGDVARQGIRDVEPALFEQARSQGESIKLIAGATLQGEGVHGYVRPESRHRSDSLGRLRHGEMGIVFHTDVLGDVTSTVQETGGVPTALTVLRDIVNLARDRR